MRPRYTQLERHSAGAAARLELDSSRSSSHSTGRALRLRTTAQISDWSGMPSK
jgi:hypothetical protein